MMYNNTIIVDPEDQIHLATHTWYIGKAIWCRSNGQQLILGRLILDAPDGFDVDHINRNTLDNRKSNLRIVTRQTNLLNRNGKYVYHDVRTCTWFVQIRYKGGHLRKRRLSYEEAQVAAKDMKKQIFLEYLKETRDLNKHLTDEQYFTLYEQECT